MDFSVSEDHTAIRDGVAAVGTNLWVLMLAILIVPIAAIAQKCAGSAIVGPRAGSRRRG